MIVIIGESGSGKSTVQQELINSSRTVTSKFKKLVTYTTRPPRPCEINGVDYHFVTDDVFKELKDRDFFIETAEYATWHYGSPKYDIDGNPLDDNTIAILTPSGLRRAKEKGIELISFYLKVDRRSRLIKILSRGDNIEEAYRRSLSDVGQFDGVENEVDYVIDNSGYSKDVFEIMNLILKGVFEARSQKYGR